MNVWSSARRTVPLADGVIVTCEHAGSRIPSQYAHLFRGRDALLASHRGYDAGAQQLAAALAKRFAVEPIIHRFSRLLIDANRSEHHPALFSDVTRALPATDRELLLARYYRPHRAAVVAAVTAALTRHRRVLHLAAHSFTPVLDGVLRKADVGLLYDPKRTSEREFCGRLAKLLREALPGLAVRRNYPYRGAADGLTTSLRRCFPQARYLGVEVELNQALLTNKRGAQRVMSAIAQCSARVLRIERQER